MTAHTAFKVERIALTSVRWAHLILGMATLDSALAHARLEAANLDMEFPQAQYRIRCERLSATVPDSELIVGGIELRPLAGDEAFFAAHAFQTPRFRVVVPECRVFGLAFGELFQGKSYRAGSVYFLSPSFEALLHRDKPPAPFGKSPLSD